VTKSTSVDVSERPGPRERGSLINLLVEAGPGIITGASDDDPSGIATYSQAGAQFGMDVLWLPLFSYPLMCAIQEISARIGRVTGVGIAANIRKTYSRAITIGVVSLVLVSGVFNLGADLGAMAESAHMLLGARESFLLVAIAAICVVLQIFIPYTTYVKYLRWLAFSLFAYVVTALIVKVNWQEALRATFIPPVRLFHGDYITVAVAVLGTTISPYLFFWQASQEAEEVHVRAEEKPLKKSPEQAPGQLRRIRFDTYLGMAVSNVIAFFIMLTTAVTLHAAGKTNIQTATEAASALQPLVGRFAYILFAAGIIGTGLLGVPVLAGSSAYAFGEAMQWRASLQVKPRKAVKFYATLAAATVLGLLLNFLHISPIRALFIAAVINGLVSSPVMVLVMLLASSRKVMGEFTVPRYLQIGGWVATGAMFLASVAFLVGLVHR
jgi:NRAMP (natural resistance-associated macrophage protein)-like metal ion transporter